MSNKGRLKPNRTLAILVARGMAECQPGQAHVANDPWCPALASQSMMDCICKPLILIDEMPV